MRFNDQHSAGLILVFAPFIFFACYFHIEILDPTNFYWLLQNDWGQHAIGQRALWYSEWSFPLTRSELIYPPVGAETALTDSNPLLSLLLKPFAPLFPSDFQVMGLWFLLMVYLQAWIGYLLISRYSPTKTIAALSGLIFLLWPAFWARMDHDTLMAHWLILLGLWIYVTPKDSLNRLAWFSGLLMLAASIHATLFLICAAIWSAEPLRLMWQASRRTTSWLHTVLMSSVPPVLAFSLLFLLGTLPGGGGWSWGFGEYSLNLNAPFNSVTGWGSVFFNPLPMHYWQRFEGYAYFGAGLIALLAFIAVLTVFNRNKTPLPPPQDKISLGWLWLPMLGCLLIALSSTVRLGELVLIDIPLSDETRQGTLAPIRSSARFFWPIAYLLIFLALRQLLQMRQRLVLGILALVMGLQTVDLLTHAVYHRTKTQPAATQTTFQRTHSPIWNEILDETKSVVFIPPRAPDDHDLLYELGWRALGRGAYLNAMYMSRIDPRHNYPSQIPLQKLMVSGPQPETLYVYHTGCTGAAKHRTGLYLIDGILIRPPESAQEALSGHIEEKCR